MPQRIPYPCPVCASLKEIQYFLPWNNESDPAKLYGAASGIQGTQRLVKCAECGMIYESPRFEDEVILKGYLTSEEAGHDSQYAMRVKSFYLTLKKLTHLIPPPGSRVLDIGTAGGAFLEAATQYGYRAYGIEPSEDLVTRGIARGLNIQLGTIENHNFEHHSFDLVCFWDVIEHIPNPKSALSEAKKLLKPDGILLINYPGIDTWQAKLAGKRFWWFLSVHLHYFSRKTIVEICNRTGFEVFHFQKYFQILEFGYLENMAAHYKIPLARTITKHTPEFIQRISIPYYASQTTTLARIAQ